MTPPRVLEITGEIQAKLLLIQQIQAEIAALNEEQIQLLAEEERTEQPDFSGFPPQISELLMQLWDAENHFLSHVDIQEDVMLDDQAEDNAIRQLIHKANTALRKSKIPYAIESLKKRGYRLIENRYQNVTKKRKRRNKPRKQG